MKIEDIIYLIAALQKAKIWVTYVNSAKIQEEQHEVDRLILMLKNIEIIKGKE